MANLERIREVVALMEEDEREHKGKHFDMHTFVSPPKDPTLPLVCNTTFCFAGWALVSRDGMQDVLNKAIRQGRNTGEYYATDWAIDQLEIEACLYLGLTETQGDAIFYSTGVKKTEELKEVITDVLDKEIWEGVIPESSRNSGWRL